MGLKLEEDSVRRGIYQLCSFTEKASIFPEINVCIDLGPAIPPPLVPTMQMCSWPPSPAAWLAHELPVLADQRPTANTFPHESDRAC